jgi:hypothetical protein
LTLLLHLRLNKQEDGSHGNFDYRFGDWTWNRFAVFFQAFEITLDRIANIRHRFITRLSLGDATRQGRTFGNEHTILVGLDCDSKFHPGKFSSWELLRNGTPRFELVGTDVWRSLMRSRCEPHWHFDFHSAGDKFCRRILGIAAARAHTQTSAFLTYARLNSCIISRL